MSHPSPALDDAHTARSVLGALWPVLEPRSIVEVGPQPWEWCAAARDLGADRAHGLQRGDWTPDVFDLAITTVASCITGPSKAERAVDRLAALGCAVLLGVHLPSGAIREGANPHWPDAWAQQFRHHGLFPFEPPGLPATFARQRQALLLFTAPELHRLPPLRPVALSLWDPIPTLRSTTRRPGRTAMRATHSKAK